MRLRVSQQFHVSPGGRKASNCAKVLDTTLHGDAHMKADKELTVLQNHRSSYGQLTMSINTPSCEE